MTPSKLRERLAEASDRVDKRQYARALQAVRGMDADRER